MAGAGWVRVVAVAPAELGELAADALWLAGTAGVEEQALGDGTVRLLAGFATPIEGEAGREALAAVGLTAEIEVVEDDGLDGWRAHARAERAGPFWLVPAWLPDPDGASADDVLRLDPGRTFGSGSHATTRLVVEHLARLVGPGDRVIDVGTGSGVLAVAAARLGAASVDAIDVDPASPATVAANAARNGVAERIVASGEPLAALVARRAAVDVVAANLLAPIVRELAAELVAAVADGGHLIVSGLLADRWADGVAPLAGLEVLVVTEEDGWAAVVLTRTGTGDR